MKINKAASQTHEARAKQLVKSLKRLYESMAFVALLYALGVFHIQTLKRHYLYDGPRFTPVYLSLQFHLKLWF